MNRPSVIVVGAGISGLASAWALREIADVTVLEAAGRIGGKIATATFRSHPLDLGPDAFIVRNRAGIELCDELGLGPALIEPSSKSAAIYARGRLRAFPEKLVFGIPTRLGALQRSHVVSAWSVLRTLRDRFAHTPLVSPALAESIRAGNLDPTVGEILRGRLGPKVVSSLIDPLVGGINASDVDALSFASAMPVVFERIIGQPSVMRALRTRVEPVGTTTGSIFRGLSAGMSSLVERLGEALVAAGVTIVRDERVRTLSRDASGAHVLECDSGVRLADAVILATPAFVSADLVRACSPELAHELDAIPYASVATATFAWRLGDVPKTIARDLRQLGDRNATQPTGRTASPPLPGSGVLVARDAQMLTTATSFTSTKWPRSANPDEVVIRASVGRHHDERIATMDDAALLAQIRAEIATVLGITAEPLEVLIQRWPRSFPQYDSGHAARVGRIEQIANGLGIDLVGAAYHGIGIPACIALSRTVAHRLGLRFGAADEDREVSGR